MAFLANISTQQEILWGSNFEGPVALGFSMALLFVYASFNNILTIDELEFENDLQASFFTFKRKLPFIFSASDNKTVFSKKTFVLEIVGYSIAFVILTLFAISLFSSVDTSFSLAWLSLGIALTYGIPTCVLRDITLKKTKRLEKEALKKLSIDEDDE